MEEIGAHSNIAMEDGDRSGGRICEQRIAIKKGGRVWLRADIIRFQCARLGDVREMGVSTSVFE